jgi:hypothetical protein
MMDLVTFSPRRGTDSYVRTTNVSPRNEARVSHEVLLQGRRDKSTQRLSYWAVMPLVHVAAVTQLYCITPSSGNVAQ